MDVERMTGLPIDQLLDITVSVAPLLRPDEVAAWTSLYLFESVVVTAAYLRQNATEDLIAAIFDVSQATVSRRRTALEEPIAAALADLGEGHRSNVFSGASRERGFCDAARGRTADLSAALGRP